MELVGYFWLVRIRRSQGKLLLVRVRVRVIHTLSPKVGGLVSCFGLPRLVGPKVGRLVSCFSLPWLVGPVSWLARLMLIVGSDSWQNRLLLLA